MRRVRFNEIQHVNEPEIQHLTGSNQSTLARNLLFENRSYCQASAEPEPQVVDDNCCLSFLDFLVIYFCFLCVRF